jgi:S-formylglutathione hydrolase FrmB
MRWSAGIAAATIAAFVLATAGAASANQSSCANDPPPKPSPRIERIQVEGLFVNVLLPSDYASSPARRYPVLYLLHAVMYNENTWLDLSDVEKFTAGYTGDKAAIVVMPDGGPMGWYTDWPGGEELWESYHLMHVIPAIEARFRTLADRAHRAVAGFSMGGYGALLYAARRPDLFSVVGGFSPISHLTIPDQPYQGATAENAKTDAGSPGPAFAGRPHPYRTPDDANSGCNGGSKQWGSGVRDIQWHARNPADLASNLRTTSIYVASGNGVPCSPDDPIDRPTFAFEPGDAGTLVMTRDYFDPAARAAGAHVSEDFYGCGVHTMRYAERDLHAFWPLMLAAFGGAPPPKFDYRSADADFAVWNWTFHADPKRATEFLEVRGAGAGGFTLTGSGTETVVTPDMFRPGQAVAVEGAEPASALADADGRLTLRVDLGAAHRDDQFSGQGQPSFVTRIVRFKPGAAAPGTHAERSWIHLPRIRSCRSHPGSVVARLVPKRATGERLVSVSAYVRGKRVLRVKRPHISTSVVVRGLGLGRARIGVSGLTSAGRRVAARRTYPRCRAAAPRARHDVD